MVDLDELREQIAGRLNIIREEKGSARNGKDAGPIGLFGPGRPLGIYDGTIFAYFTDTGQIHPITPLLYLSRTQGARVAEEVLGIVLEGVGEVASELSETARKRIEHWRQAPAGSRLRLEVPDDIAYRILRPSVDYMLGHYVGTDYRTAQLLGQILAWFLGDPLMEKSPTRTLKVGAVMDDSRRTLFQRLVLRNLRAVFEANGLELGERVKALD